MLPTLDARHWTLEKNFGSYYAFAKLLASKDRSRIADLESG
jgi:hypothetical protein